MPHPIGDLTGRNVRMIVELGRATRPHLSAQEIEQAGAAVAPVTRRDDDDGTQAPTA